MAKIFTKGDQPKEEVKDQFESFFDANDTAEGFQDINSETMAIPFIKIAQQLSPAMKSNKPEYIEGLKLGQFYNSVTKEIYGTKIGVVAGKFDRIYTEWLPKRKGFVGYHTPDEALALADDTTFGKWKRENGNLLQENYVYYVVVLGHEHEKIMIISLTSTQIKKAKAWNRNLTTTVMPNGVTALPYYLKWELETVEEHRDDNDYFGLSINYKGLVDESHYNLVKEERTMIEHKKVDFAQIEDNSQSVEDAEDGDVDY